MRGNKTDPAETRNVAGRIQTTAVRAYVERLHLLAEGIQGKLIVATYGQDPSSKNAIPAKVCHFAVGDVDGMEKFIIQVCSEPHRNVYVSLAAMQLDLASGKKGGESDVVAVLGLCADFDAKDDPEAGKWADRMPVKPTMVLQTSTEPEPSFQAFLFFDKPISFDEAKPLAVELQRRTGCDFGTKDLSHVWRVPGLLNCPNAKKVNEHSRPPEPQNVLEVLPFDIGRLCNPEELEPEVAETNEIEDVEVPEELPEVDIGSLPIPTRFKQVALTGKDPDDPEKYKSGTDRSAALFAVLLSMASRGCTSEQMLSVALRTNSPISQHVRDQSDPKRYAARQVAKAKQRSAGNALEELNNRHAVVSEEGRTLVINFENDRVLNRTKITRSSFEDFRNRYNNKQIMASGKMQPLGNWWVNNPRRRQYEGVVFRPGKDTGNFLNLWQGMAIEPVKGDWSLLRDHILHVICGGDAEVHEYLLSWLAMCVQYPGKPGEVAIVLRGKQGTGKGFFIREFGKCWGQHFIHVTNGRHLTGNFNVHLEDAVVVFADEAFWGGDKKGAGVLKALITEPTLPVEAKYRNLKFVRNCVHLLLATNSDWAVPAGVDERRYLILDVSDSHAQDHKYFEALAKQMIGGGRQAMLFDLQNRGLKNFDVRTMPKTQALYEQKLLGLEIHQKWWFQKLTDGQLLPDHEYWKEVSPTSDLYDDYVQFSNKAGQSRKSVETELGRRIRTLLPPMYPRKLKVKTTVKKWDQNLLAYEEFDQNVPSWQFPPLAECRRHWDQLTKHTEDWLEEEFPEEDEGNEEIPF
jgi:hypothetical protein